MRNKTTGIFFASWEQHLHEDMNIIFNSNAAFTKNQVDSRRWETPCQWHGKKQTVRRNGGTAKRDMHSDVLQQ